MGEDLDVKELEAFLSEGLSRPPGFEEGPERGVYAGGDPWANYKSDSKGYGEWENWSKDASWSKDSNGWWEANGKANGKWDSGAT